MALSNGARQSKGRSRLNFESLEPRQVLAANLVITEFQAINDSTLLDGDGNYSDWIELHNPTSETINLDGWHLTDDRENLDRWALPNLDVAAGEYLVIFASGENKTDAAGNFHTNFKLSGSGEDLLLVQPDGVTFDSQFLGYPEQSADVSYGFNEDGISDVWVGVDSRLSYHVPIAGEHPTDWTQVDFDDGHFIDEQTISGSGLLITELGTGSEKFIEIQNVSDQSINTDGWTLAINDAELGLSEVSETQWVLPSNVDAGQTLYRTDRLADEYWGAAIPWQAEGPGWVTLVDGDGAVRDFVAWGYTDGQISTIRADIGPHVGISFSDHWRGTGAEVGTTGGVISDPVTVGPGSDLPDANQVDSSGIRLNIEPDFVQTVAAGTYDVQEVAIAANSNGNGELRTFLAVRTNDAPSYETIWVSAPTEPAAGDTLHTIQYEPGVEQFTVDTETDLYSGVWHDGDAKVRFSNQRTVTNHDNSPMVPSTAGQEVANFSHAGLNNRTYAYGVTIGTEGAARSTLTRIGSIDSDSSDDWIRQVDATVGTQNPESTSLFGGTVPTIAGIGFNETHNQFADLIQTNVAAEMLGTNASVWTRFEFESGDLTGSDELLLRVRYDDGFQAYLDGVPLTSRNSPTTLSADTQATAERSNSQAIEFEDIDVSQALSLLDAGNHVLSVHVLNVSASDADLLFQAELISRSEGVAQYFSDATPGAASSDGGFNTVADTKFSTDRGLYSTPISVGISTETVGATIVYTTDGSPPLIAADGSISHGTVYSSPLNIDRTTTVRAMALKPGLVSSNIDTQTYLFTADVAQQTRNATIASGFPTRWGSRSADYGIDPDVVGPSDKFGGVYTDAFENALTSMPTLSLVMDTDDVFGSQGIYSNVGNRGEAWERPVSAELIYPDGREGFQIDAGIRMHGGASRNLSSKNNFRLLFREQYGDSKLEFPLFGDGVDRFDTLVLRAHFNDGWGWSGAEGDPLFSRDQWHRETQAAMGHTASRSEGVHLYINGIYWGIYSPAERPDASFTAQHLGGDKTEWDARNHGGTVDGNDVSWNRMLSLAAAVEQASSQSAKWDAFQRLQGRDSDGDDVLSREAYLDLENYIDYMMLSFYSGNDDWPNRNWYAARKRGTDSDGFQFFAWDSEISMDLSSRTHLNENVIVDTNNNARGVATAYGSLRRYDEFQLAFADRVHKHFFNDGVFYVDSESPEWDPEHPERNPSAARMVEIANAVADGVIAESARWGDQHRNQPYTRNAEWQSELEHLLDNFFPNRSRIVLGQLRSQNLYPDIDAPEYMLNGTRQHGGYVDQGSQIGFESTDPFANIWYTTDGTDPRLPGGDVHDAHAKRFTGEIQLEKTSTLKARIEQNGQWSALSEAVFAYDQSGIRVAEVHYNPADPTADELAVDASFDNDQFEFLELVNEDSEIIDLADLQIAGDVRFTFSDQQLEPGERAVVVRDIDAFAARYPDAVDSVVGEYQGSLSNDGDRLQLVDVLGQVLSEFEFNDNWFDQTDGEGFSLVNRQPSDLSANLNAKAAWRPSIQLGGSPGEANQLSSLPEDFDGSGVVDFADFLQFSAAFGSSELDDLELYDLDDSDDVGFGDFLLFSNAFGRAVDRR